MSTGIITHRKGEFRVRKQLSDEVSDYLVPIARDEKVKVYHEFVPHTVTAGEIEDALNNRPTTDRMRRLIPSLRELTKDGGPLVF